MVSTLICVSATLLLPTAYTSTKVSNTSQEVRTAVHVQAIEKNPAPAAATIVPPVPAYLERIGIPDAWDILNKNVTATIAIVDTGVDFKNPLLKPYLLNGINLVNGRKSAQDDNGHGTAVAGILYAIARAGETSSGSGRWEGKFLPVKALDQYGSGNEAKLTEGIRYSVDQGADIVVLSLGLRRDAPGLREAVEYAERKGTLLVAAGGNDAAVFGDRAAVQYPAAYPTVLAVAGSQEAKPIEQSTSGPENDVGAVWRVQTLAMNGGGIVMEGTSMGAPQAAATAAMLMAIHPDWKPIQIRETLRRTADIVGKISWSPHTGYGFISASRALQAEPLKDWREPNNSRESASEFPLGKEVVGDWSKATDIDWFTIEVPYEGILTLLGDKVNVSVYKEQKLITPIPKSATALPDNQVNQWALQKGRYWMRLTSKSSTIPSVEGYRLVSEFRMKPDAKEPNNSAASASTLPPRSQKWAGTFHARGDRDWMVLTLPKPGILRLSVSPDTTRIDPELWIHSADGSEIIIDQRGDGADEHWVMNNAKPGRYYFRISNAVSTNPEAVIGTYAAALEYITEKEDYYEPNESPLTSTPLSPGKVYNGLIHKKQDQDWYKFTIKKKQRVTLTVSRIPNRMDVLVELKNKKLQNLHKWSNDEGQKTLLGVETLQPGTYYVRVSADSINQNQYYGLKLQFL